MVARAFAWIATGGGAWSLASNWNDLTDGIDPSLIVPGALDSVTVAGPTGSTAMTLTGQGSVASAAFAGNTIVTGSLSAGTVALGAAAAGGLLDIGGGGSLTAGTFTAASGSVIASGSTSRIQAAALVLGAGQTGGAGASCGLDATNGGMIQAASLVLDAGTATVYADPASSIEVGTLGGAITGALTVDAGATLSGQGDANAYAKVVNNGTIAASGGTLLVGALSGQGLLSIGAGAVLDLNGVTGAGQNLQFAGAQGTLALSMELNAPQGTLTGFAPGDAIDEIGSPISAATFVQTKAAYGVLTLWYGNQVADTLTLAGNYAKDAFLTAGDGAEGTLITVSPQTGGGGGPSGGTPNPDQYQWIAPGSGNWNQAANWENLTTGADPAKIAPGVNDLVSIQGATNGGFTVIAGPANAATLGITGNLALGGVYSIGTLTIGQTGAPGVAGVLDLLPGANMAAASAAIADGGLSVSGSAVLAVSGALTLGGGPAGTGLPISSLQATAGGTITAASLTLGGGSGDSITTDPTGVIEIGAAGGASTGAVTVDQAASLTGNGAVNPFGALVDNGTITASGGALTLGSVTGTGALAIATQSALILNYGTALPIAFADATGELAVANERVALTGAIAGFVPGDTIDILNDPITGVATAASGGNTTVTLYYGAMAVDQLTLAGSYTGYRFILAPDGGTGTDLQVAKGSGGGGGGGQGSTDLMAWATPGSGAWGRTANWYDVTTGAAALAPPGADNAVELIGTSGAFQVIGGPGVCASLACYGNTALSADFTTGTLTVGGSLNGTATAAILDVGPSSGATATTASADSGKLLVNGAATTLSVTSTLTLGGVSDGTLSVTNHGTAAIGFLALGGAAASTVTADTTSSVEIGTLGTGAAGAVTVDAGFAISGFGAVNPYAQVTDNGTITAQGGTLELGAVSGTGVLSIAGEATLSLTLTDTTAIDFAGGGATLLLAGTEEAPAGINSGFAAGDAIVTGSSQVSAVAYAPGAGNIGTLTLYDGTSVAGSLLLAGNFAGDSFVVQPDGQGSEIGLQAAASGPSQCTPTPDNYVWTGAAGTLWNTAANWSDLTANQNSAAIAPGAHDLVSIQGATGTAFTTITGPADAASLAILGNVSLAGSYSIGALAVGVGGAGVLALGAGTTLDAASASIAGALLAAGSDLSTGGTLSLTGLLQATAGAQVQTAAAVLSGAAALTTDGSAGIEIGLAGGAIGGAVTVDQNALLAGAGDVNPQGAIIDQGTITASGGTLLLGTVSGGGLLDIGVNATLDLASSAGAGLLIDFTGPGTLSLPELLPLAAIAGFGAGDSILLPLQGVTQALYAATAPGTGVLSLIGNGQTLGRLTLQGVGLGQTFTLTAAAGGTILTTQTTTWGGGGSNMRNPDTTNGGGSSGVVQDYSWWQSLPSEVQSQLVTFQNAENVNSYVWTSPDGTGWGNYEPGYANFAVAQDPAPDSGIALPPGYEALLLQGGNNVLMGDGGQGGTLLMGNQGNDTICALGDGDTLVGGAGANTLFFASNAIGNSNQSILGTDIYGGGNDTIVTNNGPAKIFTSTGGHSLVFVGPAANAINLGGTDMVVTAGGTGANDTVNATGADTVFAPSVGQLVHNGGAGADILVGGGGTLIANGGAGNGSQIWANTASLVEYNGGTGSASVFGGAGTLEVDGGGGAITVFAGTGTTYITGASGPSQFVLGSGNATVSAATGNDVWLASAANDSLVASGGNVLLWAGGSTGSDVMQAGNGPVTMQGGLGNDTFIGGLGNSTMAGGSGADVFSFTNGLGGGADIVSGFSTARDVIQLHGYATYTDSLVGGSEVITLPDKTRIDLIGITSMTGVHITLG
jgi:hypothetical protein